MDDPTSRVEHIPLPLVLVNIPRSSLLEQIHTVVAQLFKARSFFSITLNTHDVTLIVEESLGRELSHGPTHAPDPEQARDCQTECSPDVTNAHVRWNALSLDVASSPNRLRKISDLMQASGIPVLYQSAINCDYLFVPSENVQKALAVLEDFGLTLTDDETAAERSRSQSKNGYSRSYEKSHSRRPKRRTYSRHEHRETQKEILYGTPTNSSQSPTTPENVSPSSPIQRGRPTTKQRSSDSPIQIPPLKVLSHQIAFHGINTGMSGDWLLKLIKLLGWPETVLPAKPDKRELASLPPILGYNPHLHIQNGFSLSLARPGMPNLTSTAKPRRPGFTKRHSDDAQSMHREGAHSSHSSEVGLTLKALKKHEASPGPTSRSRSTSYPEFLPDFYQQHQPKSAGPIGPSDSYGTSPAGFALGFQRMDGDSALVDDTHSTKVDVSTKRDRIKTPNELHVAALPFFSLTFRAKEFNETEVSVMARGRLLAQLFESSMLIGGSGEIALSDSGEDDTDGEGIAPIGRSPREKTWNPHMYPLPKSTPTIEEEELDFTLPSVPLSPRPDIRPSGSRRSTQSGFGMDDDSFKCLQFNVSDLDENERARLLSLMAERLNYCHIRHHFARTIGVINVLVPHSQTQKACEILVGEDKG